MDYPFMSPMRPERMVLDRRDPKYLVLVTIRGPWTIGLCRMARQPELSVPYFLNKSLH
jgi:hypothetical protein